MSQAARAIAAVLLGAVAFALLSPMPASAHAYVVETTPGNGAVLDAAPAEVRIVFNEPVQATVGGLRVFDGDAGRVDDGALLDTPADEVAVALGGLDDGGYVVAYQVTSADGHPVRGLLSFTVGDGELDAEVMAEIAADAESPSATVIGRALRTVGYVAGLLAVGSLVFGTLVARAERDRSLARSVGLVAGLVAAAAAAATIPVQAVVLAGAPAAAADPGFLVEVVASPFGLAAVLRVVALLALVAFLAVSTPVLALAPGAAVIGSYLLDGHQRTVEPAWLLAGADAVHLGAGAVWFAGVVLLALGLRRQRDEHPERAAHLVSRFSAVALVCVALVTAAGVAMAVPLLGSPRALTSTSYGWLLVAKSGVVALVVAVAVVNRWVLVPRVVAAPTGDASTAWRRLSSALRVEAVLLVGVLAVTGVLVVTQPPSQAAGLGGWYEVTGELGDDHEVLLVSDPNRAGTNSLHLFVFGVDDPGQPSDDVDDLALELTHTAEQIGPLRIEPSFVGPGHWLVITDDLVLPGEWQVRVTAGFDRFTEESAQLMLPVAP